MLETIKDYLISLGFRVDTSSLNSAQQAMSSAEHAVSQFTGNSTTNFAKAAIGVISFVATANLALAKFVGGLAQADLQTEMFARKMWMSKDAAKAYQGSIDALGVSINDLYLSPELMQKYLSLNGQARGMSVPADEYNKQMQGVRDITFQFQRLKLEGTYALQWIGYYLTKYLAGPLGNAKDWLTKINDTIQEKMPQWTEKVAMVASWFVRLGAAIWSIRNPIIGIGLLFASYKIMSSPLALMILGLTALLLLIDDFNTYNRGGKSAFPELWKWFNTFGDTLSRSGLDLKSFKTDIGELVTSVWKLGKELDNLLKKLGVEGGLKEALETGIISILTFLRDLITSVTMGIKELTELIGGDITLGDILSGKADKKFESEPADNGNPVYGFLDDAVFNAIKKLRDFFSKLSFSTLGSGITPISYLYPQYNTSHTARTTISPTYNIYGATQPAAVAQTVHKTTSSLIRHTQGGIR